MSKSIVRTRAVWFVATPSAATIFILHCPQQFAVQTIFVAICWEQLFIELPHNFFFISSLADVKTSQLLRFLFTFHIASFCIRVVRANFRRGMFFSLDLSYSLFSLHNCAHSCRDASQFLHVYFCLFYSYTSAIGLLFFFFHLFSSILCYWMYTADQIFWYTLEKLDIIEIKIFINVIFA